MHRIFNIENWGRKNTFHFYRNFDDPYFNITANVNVTGLRNHAKLNKQSFFLSTLHTALYVVNTIDNFKMRIDGDQIKIYNIIHGGSTLLYEDESFGFGYYDYCEDKTQFIESASEIIRMANEEKSFNPSNSREDLIYFSSLPWITFTSFKHAQDRHINRSIPRITFGKYFKSNGIYKMPINVEVNHALMDGYHVGIFFEKFEALTQ